MHGELAVDAMDGFPQTQDHGRASTAEFSDVRQPHGKPVTRQFLPLDEHDGRHVDQQALLLLERARQRRVLDGSTLNIVLQNTHTHTHTHKTNPQ